MTDRSSHPRSIRPGPRPGGGTPGSLRRADDALIVQPAAVGGPGGSGGGGGGAGGGRGLAPLRLMGSLARRAVAALLGDDRLALGVLLVLAAAVRLPGLADRGGFDGDQGHDMLVLLRFLRDGEIPLLGPPTSIGDFHHGAAYYFLLAPAAAISGVDPGAVVTWIALLGIGAVGATWWFGREVGGPLVGLIAGLILAVSPAAIDESIFIWNPNPIPLAAAVSLGSAWRARRTGRARWWILAVAAAGLVAQLHVLGVVMLPVVIGLGATGGRGSRRVTLTGIAAGLVVIALLYLPLVVHELTTDFSETRRALDYFATEREDPALDPLQRVVFTLVRAIGWPLAGIVTSAPIGSILVVSMTVGLVAWRVVAARDEERTVVRWLAAGLGWAVVALAILAPSLATVVAGLPNDHYHAFLDPVVVVLLAAGFAPLLGQTRRGDAGARAVAILVLVVLVGFEASRWPAFRDPNGGWAAARAAGERIVARGGPGPYAVAGLPRFKTTDGIGFPIEAAGAPAIELVTDEGPVRGPLPGERLVIVCDRLFERIIGDPCGGVAEDRLALEILTSTGGERPRDLVVIDRFDLSPRTSVTVYAP